MAKRGTTPETLPDDHGAALEKPGGEPPPSGALAELIRVEERVRAAIREAETETARAIAEAEAEAGDHSDAQDQALDTALRELEEQIEAQRSAAIVEASRRSDEAIRQIGEIDQARIEALAELVVRRIAEGGPESEGSAR